MRSRPGAQHQSAECSIASCVVRVLHRRYRAIVGALGWLNQGTRPDISYLSELSKFVQCPGQKHMDAAEYCLKCLTGTVDLCIHYGRTKDGKIEGR